MSESTGGQPERSELQIFFIKLVIIVGVFLMLFYIALANIRSALEDYAVLRGGPDFWAAVEKGLYKLADQKDVPEEKKAKIIDALRRVSSKYGPYVEALTHDKTR